MSFREDITIQWNLSPRIITVAAPATELTIQDLHDTLREHEAYPENMAYPSIISSAGKESLGGGVRVGITSTLLNAKVAFEARKQFTVTGSITTPDPTGRLLIDSTANFISSSVQPGAWVVNLDKGSVCSVVTVDSATQLTTNVLGGGTSTVFDFGDNYRVQNVIQCDIAGGNLVALNASGSEMSPVLPTVGTQIVRTSAASATLQELADIQYSSFSGGVTINVSSSYAGTDYPIGTPRAPVNNLADANSIAVSRGFKKFFIVDSLNVDAGSFVDMHFVGESPTNSYITVVPSANVSQCTFENMTISGTLDGGSQIKNCRILELEYVDGFVEQCVLNSTIFLVGDAHLLDCWSGVPGSSTPSIDFNGTNSKLALRNYNGGIALKNKTGSEPVSIDLNSGQVFLDSTVQNGLILIRGIGKLTDNSTGTTIVDSTHLLSPSGIAEATWSTPVSGSTAANRLTELSSLANAVSDALIAAQTQVNAGSTSSTLLTGLTQSDGFFDGMFVNVISSAGACVRQISYYESAGGTLHFDDPLPFTPNVSDTVYVLLARSSHRGGIR